jgi:hypothetical protein
VYRRTILTARPEQSGVARLIAVRLSLVLGVVPRGQGFVALLTAQAGTVPVLPQRRLPLRCGHKGIECICYSASKLKDEWVTLSGPYYSLGTIGTVPRAYEEMEGKNKNKEMKNRKKKIQDFKNTSKKFTISLPV